MANQLELDLQGGTEAGTTDPAIETKARAVGWVPEAEFSGDKARWKDASAFLDYADHVTPILRKNNQKLFTELSDRDRQIAELRASVDNQARIVKALTASQSETAVADKHGKLEQLRTKLTDANKEGDFELVAAIQEDMMDIKAEIKLAKEKPVDDQQVGNTGAGNGENARDPIFDAWMEENTWMTDPVMQAAATAIGHQIASEHTASGKTMPKGRALLDEITKRVDNRFNISNRPAGDKVDGGSHTGGTSAGGGGNKRFNSLPADARDICNKQAAKFVGAGKRYEKLDQWQSAFTKSYYEES